MANAFTSNGLFGSYLSDPEIADEFSAPRFLERMIRFERAWTAALMKTGAVSTAAGEQALKAMRQAAIDSDRLMRAAGRDGLAVPEWVRLLKAEAGEAEHAVHTGATSQDVIDTAMSLTLRAVAERLSARLAEILAAVDGLDETFGAYTIMGRTRMQAARPIPVSARLATWSVSLRRARDRLAEIASSGLPAQVGGAVGLREHAHGGAEGSGQDIAALVADELSLPLTEVWHSDRAPVVEFGHRLVLTCGALGKLGQDVALMAQQGVEEIVLAPGGTSSAMPHKNNPVAAEALVALARYVACLQGGLAQGLIHEQERSGAAWAIEWLTIPLMAESTGASTRHALALLGQVKAIGRPA